MWVDELGEGNRLVVQRAINPLSVTLEQFGQVTEEKAMSTPGCTDLLVSQPNLP